MTSETTIYSAGARSVGNPDFRQFAPISVPERITGATVAEVVARLLEYISRWDLGGGNWPNVEIRGPNGTVVGKMSYNGRIWDAATMETEIDPDRTN